MCSPAGSENHRDRGPSIHVFPSFYNHTGGKHLKSVGDLPCAAGTLGFRQRAGSLYNLGSGNRPQVIWVESAAGTIVGSGSRIPYDGC